MAAMTAPNTTASSSSGAKLSAAPTVCRRSIRLAPKTVANLANKFEACGLLDAPSTAKSVQSGKSPKYSNIKSAPFPEKNAPSSKIPDKELKLCKKDITKIVGTLNKLEEDAKRSCYRPRPLTTPGTAVKKDVAKKDRILNGTGEILHYQVNKPDCHNDQMSLSISIPSNQNQPNESNVNNRIYHEDTVDKRKYLSTNSIIC